MVQINLKSKSTLFKIYHFIYKNQFLGEKKNVVVFADVFEILSKFSDFINAVIASETLH